MLAYYQNVLPHYNVTPHVLKYILFGSIHQEKDKALPSVPKVCREDAFEQVQV